MRVPAPAKINLHLRVGPARQADGFHPLLTWMTTVLALNAHCKLNWPTSRLCAIGESLGSYLPCFLIGLSSVCSWRGEVVRPVSALDMKWASLALPRIDLPTPAVYRRFDEMCL